MSGVGSIVSGHVDRDLAHTEHMVSVADLRCVHFGNLTPLRTYVCLKTPVVVLSEHSAFCTSSTRQNNNPFGISKCFQFLFVWPFWHHQHCFKISGGAQPCAGFQFPKSFLAQLCNYESHTKGKFARVN